MPRANSRKASDRFLHNLCDRNSMLWVESQVTQNNGIGLAELIAFSFVCMLLIADRIYPI
jgi:hypothetical protein